MVIMQLEMFSPYLHESDRLSEISNSSNLFLDFMDINAPNPRKVLLYSHRNEIWTEDNTQ